MIRKEEVEEEEEEEKKMEEEEEELIKVTAIENTRPSTTDSKESRLFSVFVFIIRL